MEPPLPPDIRRRPLHPLPKGLVELYGLLAVLFVLVPEWMADGALRSWLGGQRGDPMPVTASAWRRQPELRLAGLNLAALRLLARRLWIVGYAGLSRERLSPRILKRLKRSRRWEDWLPQEL
ncbi:MULTISPECIES: hypothetical protein [Synechococcales]|uniref:hypothetical protein n=1 Tax=Synechococcus sp. CS-1324 TaxID=2847980 RepID=UPI00223A84BB|nr:hypothetical protein [Synechococcus sp. CS-1324]